MRKGILFLKVLIKNCLTVGSSNEKLFYNATNALAENNVGYGSNVLNRRKSKLGNDEYGRLESIIKERGNFAINH